MKLSEKLIQHVNGPSKCPDCCNVSGGVFKIADSDYFNKHKPEDGCDQEGQCPWNMDYGTHTDRFDNPYQAKEDMLQAAYELAKLGL